MATKICTDSGHWFIHPESNRTWTNYTDCMHKSNDHKRVSSNLALHRVLVHSVFIIHTLLLYIHCRSKVWNNSISYPHQGYVTVKKAIL